MLVGGALATGVAVFNNGVALRLHHARKAQCLTRKRTVAICLSVLGVEDAD
jgi:hypothetical protein